MMRIPAGFPATAPWLAWGNVAWKMSEMLFASALVIQHRSKRIADAGPRPSLRDQREFTRMGQEKLEAAAESAQAMAMRMYSANMQIGASMARQMMNAAPGMMTAMMTPSLFWSPQGQAQMMRRLFAGYGSLGKQLSGASARLAGQGLRPIHSRATANAERLVHRPARRKAGKGK